MNNGKLMSYLIRIELVWPIKNILFSISPKKLISKFKKGVKYK